jgi:hypothetical protein
VQDPSLVVWRLSGNHGQFGVPFEPMGIALTSGRALALALSLALLTSACKDKPQGIDEQTQRDLTARRDALLASRKKITEDKAKIEAEIATVQAQGGDTSGLRNQLTELETQQNQQMTELIAKVDSISAVGDSKALLASREASLAQREADLARRESELAKRQNGGGTAGGDVDAKLLNQMAALSEKCGQPGATTVIAAPPPPGASYTKVEVTAVMGRARAVMSQKGLMNSDLTDPGLDAEVSKSMASGEWSKAYFAANQLLKAVESIKVNRQFVQQKAARLSRRVASSKPTDAVNKQIVSGLEEVTSRFNDGALDVANRKLNELFSLL